MKTVTILLATAGAIALAGCQTQPRLVTPPSCGNSVRHNLAVHIINPRPAMAATEATDMDGQRAAGAIGRYERGEVLRPLDVTTSSVGD